jgi:hypothetical protein
MKIPNKVTCTSCNQQKSVRKEVFLKRLYKHEGNLEERIQKELQTYICTSCKSADKMKELEKLFK